MGGGGVGGGYGGGEGGGGVFSSLGTVDVSEWALDLDTDGDGVVSVDEARQGLANLRGVAVEDVTEVSSTRVDVSCSRRRCCLVLTSRYCVVGRCGTYCDASCAIHPAEGGRASPS